MSTASQIVLITGANQGLGYHTAHQLSKLPGWIVLLGSRDATRGREAADKIKADGAISDVEVVVLDVTSDATIEAARKGIEEKYGKLDVLVVSPLSRFRRPDLALSGDAQNNAGLSFDNDKTLSPRERLRATFDVNVFGAAALVEALLPLLEKSSFPRIVNVSSTLGSITKALSPGYGYPPIPVRSFRTPSLRHACLTQIKGV